jgi:hypothetical protein
MATVTGETTASRACAAVMIADKSASLTSSANPMPCMVRCSHCPGIRSRPGKPASRSLAFAARSCTAGMSAKVAWTV